MDTAAVVDVAFPRVHVLWAVAAAIRLRTPPMACALLRGVRALAPPRDSGLAPRLRRAFRRRLPGSSAPGPPRASPEDRFAHLRPGDPDGRNRADISVGAEVDVVVKADQASGALTRGVVREFLTNSKHHPQGIKVRLVDGAIGRVQVILGGAPRAPDRPDAAAREEKPAPAETPVPRATPGAAAAAKKTRASAPGPGPGPGPGGGDPSPPGAPPPTCYLSNLPKALSKSDVAWLVEEIPGVTGLRLPRRGGRNMGYAFVTCASVEALDAVVATLGGTELDGKALVAEPARRETRAGKGAAAEERDDVEGKGSRGKARWRERGKAWKRGAGSDADSSERFADSEDRDVAPDPMAAARAEMEAEAILELERARRANARRMAEAAERKRAQEEKDAAAAARTTAMLEERRRAAERAAEEARRRREREAAEKAEAVALGAPEVDPRWERELAALAEELAALRAE